MVCDPVVPLYNEIDSHAYGSSVEASESMIFDLVKSVAV